MNLKYLPPLFMSSSTWRITSLIPRLALTTELKVNMRRGIAGQENQELSYRKPTALFGVPPWTGFRVWAVAGAIPPYITLGGLDGRTGMFLAGYPLWPVPQRSS